MSLGPAIFFAGRILGLGRRARGLDGRGVPHASGGGTPSRVGRSADDAPARRYLRGAVVGVALSIVPLVVVLIVADGMIQGITARYIETGTYHLQAQALAVVDQESLEADSATLREHPGIKAFPEMQSYGVAIAGTRTTGVAIRAVDPAFLEDPGTAAYLKLSDGSMKLEATNQILLGEPLAKALGVKAGQIITVVTERPGYAGASYIPKVSVFRVRGIVSAGYRELDALWAFISLRAGSRIFWPGESREIIGIKVDAPFGDLEPSRAVVRSALSADWDVVTWPEAERNVFRSFATTRALLLLVMALAVGVAAINVASALVMLVLERRRDIAILKSSGASPSLVRSIFVLTGLAIGAAGTVIGIGVGTLLAWRINDIVSGLQYVVNAAARLWGAISGAAAPHAEIRLLDPAYYLERIPVNIHPAELAAVAGVCLLLCFLASLLPAGRASRFPPLEIFRKT